MRRKIIPVDRGGLDSLLCYHEPSRRALIIFRSDGSSSTSPMVTKIAIILTGVDLKAIQVSLNVVEFFTNPPVTSHALHRTRGNQAPIPCAGIQTAFSILPTQTRERPRVLERPEPMVDVVQRQVQAGTVSYARQVLNLAQPRWIPQ